MSIQEAIHFTLGAEGKFVIDDGGPTMYGVTQAVYDDYRRNEGLSLQSVRLIEMDEVEDIMRREYWTPAHCDDLGNKMGVAHFDWSYNHGDEGGFETLQIALGFTGDAVDGKYGPHTKAAAQAAGDSVLGAYLDARRQWYRDAAKRNPAKYGEYLDGWLNRVDNLEKYLASL